MKRDERLLPAVFEDTEVVLTETRDWLSARIGDDGRHDDKFGANGDDGLEQEHEGRKDEYHAAPSLAPRDRRSRGVVLDGYRTGTAD